MSGEHGTPATADAESSAVPDADRLIQEMLYRSVVERAADEVTHNSNRSVTGPASQPDRGCDSRERWRFNVAVQRMLQFVSEGGSERSCRRADGSASGTEGGDDSMPQHVEPPIATNEFKIGVKCCP